MSKLKNRITAYIKDNLKHEDQFDNIKSKLNLQFKKKEEKCSLMNFRKSMKLILPCVLLVICTIIGIILVTGNSPVVDAKAIAVVQMDVNPSISFVVDENNIVLSVYGENDEGKMIINNEEIVGLKLELAVEKIITIESQTGYLITGDIQTEKNKISFSIESDKDSITNDLENKINKCVSNTCDKLNIEENIEFVKSKAKEKLVKRVTSLDPTVSLEKANEMTNEQLLAYISGCQLEKINIPTQQLEELYNNIKKQEITFVEKEETKKFIDSLDSTYQTLMKSYNELYIGLITAQEKLNESYVTYFINETSQYQMAVKKCQELKLEVLKLEQEVSQMEESPSKKVKEQILKVQKEKLDLQIKTLDITKVVATEALDLLNKVIDTTLVKMDEFYNNLPDEIKTDMQKSLSNLEQLINEKKSNCFKEFEEKYKAQIENAYNNSKQYKQQLIEQLKQK